MKQRLVEMDRANRDIEVVVPKVVYRLGKRSVGKDQRGDSAGDESQTGEILHMDHSLQRLADPVDRNFDRLGRMVTHVYSLRSFYGFELVRHMPEAD